MIDRRYSNRAHADLVFVNMMELIKLHALMHREPAAPACVICSSNQLRYGLFGHILLLIIILIPKLFIFLLFVSGMDSLVIFYFFNSKIRYVLIVYDMDCWVSLDR